MQVIAPWRPDARAQISALYRDIEGRDGEAGGLDAWAQLHIDGMSLIAIRDAFEHSAKVQTKLTQSFQTLFGPQPTNDKIAA